MYQIGNSTLFGHSFNSEYTSKMWPTNKALIGHTCDVSRFINFAEIDQNYSYKIQ